MKQDSESEEAATRMMGLQGPGQRVAKEHPEHDIVQSSSGSQVRGSENGEDGARLPRSDL